MAGFGLRSLKKQQDDSQQEITRSYFQNIIVGENPYGYLAFNKIFADTDGKALFITQNLYLSEQINRDLNCTMNSIRSAEVADELSFNEFEISDATSESVFYKDTKFHKFGARAKPHQLLDGEEFFTSAFHPLQMKLDINDEVLKKHQQNKIIKKIVLKEPTDLVEPAYFELHTGENEIISCEKLYFCENPRHFYKLVENKDKLNAGLHKYLVGIEAFPGITVHFKCKGEFSDHVGSMIIPQSLTHEWGSFILDIEAFKDGYQNFKALTFINGDDLQEEDLAKKIRLMRKVLERVLPDLEKCDYSPTIKYDPNLRYTGINDELAPELKSEHVKFVGPAALLSHPKSELFQYFARASMSLSQL